MSCAGVWRTTRENSGGLRLDCRGQLDKASLLAALGDALNFPAYFGHNWDAAWDCLVSLDWPEPERRLHLHIARGLEVDEEALAVFIDLLAEAAEHWQHEGKTLALLVNTPRNDLACVQALAPIPTPP